MCLYSDIAVRFGGCWVGEHMALSEHGEVFAETDRYEVALTWRAGALSQQTHQGDVYTNAARGFK